MHVTGGPLPAADSPRPFAQRRRTGALRLLAAAAALLGLAVAAPAGAAASATGTLPRFAITSPTCWLVTTSHPMTSAKDPALIAIAQLTRGDLCLPLLDRTAV